MSVAEVAQLIVEVLIVLLLLYVAFLKSYFHEKGKNLATKEDIEEITSTVESIRSELQYSLQAKLSWRTEEHSALVDYYSKFGAWFSGILNVPLANISNKFPERVDEIRAELDVLEREFEAAESRMELFVEDSEILIECGPLKIETLKFHAHAQQTTFLFGQLFLKFKLVMLETPLDQQIVQYEALLGEQRDLYKKFKDEQKEFYQQLLPSVIKHRRTISAHLRQLVGGND
jgi:hypothetical protein